MLEAIGMIVLIIYLAGFGAMGSLIWLMGGGVWRAVPDAVIVGAVWPYIFWDWTR